jgi:hypothetical protein
MFLHHSIGLTLRIICYRLELGKSCLAVLRFYPIKMFNQSNKIEMVGWLVINFWKLFLNFRQ